MTNFKFRPEFGNNMHQKICELIGEFHSLEAKYDVYKANPEKRSAKWAKKLSDDLRSRQKTILNYIEAST